MGILFEDDTEDLCLFKLKKNEIILSKSLFNFTDLEKQVLSNFIVDFAYCRGIEKILFYPSDDNIYQSIHQLDVFDVQLMIDDDTIKGGTVCNSIANAFHPHMIETQNGKYNTLYQTFMDRSLFFDCIIKLCEIRDTTTIYLYKFIIESLRTASKTQSISNFKPTVAKYIYEKYGNNGTVLDPCMGYGGRMLGAWCSDVKKYVGIDPCTKTIEGNKKLYKKLFELTQFNTLFNDEDSRKRPQIEIIQSPFEDFNTDEKFDLVFTSPPYFNTEKYSFEDTQSWVRYKTYPIWEKKFLEPLVDKSYNYLKSGGCFAINFKDDAQTKYNIFREFMVIARRKFGEPIKIEKMQLSLLPLLMDKNKKCVKYEPIAIFRKI